MVNRMVLQGRLTSDPELRNTQSGVAVCSFSVAWSEKYNGNERKLFLDCTAWRGIGEMVSKNFHKSKEIVVEGQLETDSYTDKDGNKRSTIKMNVDKVHFCGPKSSGEPSNNSSARGFVPVDTEDDGSLPF